MASMTVGQSGFYLGPKPVEWKFDILLQIPEGSKGWAKSDKVYKLPALQASRMISCFLLCLSYFCAGVHDSLEAASWA